MSCCSATTGLASGSCERKSIPVRRSGISIGSSWALVFMVSPALFDPCQRLGQRLHQVPVAHLRPIGDTFPLHGAPDRFGEMAVIAPPGNNMPMDMRDHIAEAGKIDFLR